MASHEEIIRNLYVVAEKDPKRFRSLFIEKRLLVGRPCRSHIPPILLGQLGVLGNLEASLKK